MTTLKFGIIIFIIIYKRGFKMKKKTCIECGKSKPLSEFYSNFIYKDGLMPICKDCQKLRSKLQYEAKKERFLNEAKNN